MDYLQPWSLWRFWLTHLEWEIPSINAHLNTRQDNIKEKEGLKDLPGEWTSEVDKLRVIGAGLRVPLRLLPGRLLGLLSPFAKMISELLAWPERLLVREEEKDKAGLTVLGLRDICRGLAGEGENLPLSRGGGVKASSRSGVSTAAFRICEGRRGPADELLVFSADLVGASGKGIRATWLPLVWVDLNDSCFDCHL